MTQIAALPADVSAAAQRHLDAADATLPGLVTGLYITGSAVLGDYQPGRSDIDFMAFTSRPLTAADIGALAALHAGFAGRGPYYDGNYVGWHELAGLPDDGRAGPHVIDGEFRDEACDELTPSTWTEFARYAAAVRGPLVSELGIEISRDRLSQWQLSNLNGYWSEFAAGSREVWSGRDQDALMPYPQTACWCALGPARLHYTLATGDITSKSGAGRYALQHFGEYADLISAALDWRATGQGSFTHAAGVRITDLMRAIIDDAGRRWGTSAS